MDAQKIKYKKPGQSLCLIGGLLMISGCFSDAVRNDDAPALGAAKSGARQVTVEIVVDPTVTYKPLLVGRVLEAEQVSTQYERRAKGSYLSDGTKTVVVGTSCQSLRASVGAIESCAETTVPTLSYGETTVVAASDSSGQFEFPLGSGEFRLQLQSVQTLEDPGCRWGGSILLDARSAFAELPMLVFCE